MPLDEYRKKRDFTKTPEPSGDERAARVRAAATPERFFCVQKHLASHLHYDFRIEHNGVLLSWAVPKGPALDPKTKRLAMQTEDHPIEYGTFEGVIPEGYGAGVVMLWDVGTWEPEVSDIDQALKKGDLKMRLNGYKLKGSWVLVRTKERGPSYGPSRSWLLIKHRDEWAGDVDITTFAPRSVKSNDDFEGILRSGVPDVWFSNRPGKESGNAAIATIVRKVLALKESDGRDAEAGPAAPAPSRGGPAATRSARPRSRAPADGPPVKRTRKSS